MARRLDAQMAVEPFPDFDESLIASGTRKNSGAVLHDTDGVITIGVWEQQKNTTAVLTYPVTEFMVLIEGQVDVTVEGGSTYSFSAPQSFVIPKGLRVTWSQPGHVRKWFISSTADGFADRKAPFAVDAQAAAEDSAAFSIGSRVGGGAARDGETELVWDGKDTWWVPPNAAPPQSAREDGRVVYCAFHLPADAKVPSSL